MRIRRGRGADRGYSSVELVLYMPLLLAAILVTVQFALVYLANEYASAAAREGNRVARVTGDTGQGEAKGRQVVADMGDGILAPSTVRTTVVGADVVQTEVTGSAPRIVPFLPFIDVSETVRGPIERFDPDGAAP
jgi:Flp pilus assembly protein TadG